MDRLGIGVIIGILIAAWLALIILVLVLEDENGK